MTCSRREVLQGAAGIPLAMLATRPAGRFAFVQDPLAREAGGVPEKEARIELFEQWERECVANEDQGINSLARHRRQHVGRVQAPRVPLHDHGSAGAESHERRPVPSSVHHRWNRQLDRCLGFPGRTTRRWRCKLVDARRSKRILS